MNELKNRLNGPSLSEKSIASWHPPKNVVDHCGEPLDSNLDFFFIPPEDIGQIITAHTTLHLGVKPRCTHRWAMISLVFFCTTLGLWFALRLAYPGDLVLAINAAEFGLLCAFYTYILTLFNHMCCYVGSKGIVVATLSGKRGALVRSCLFLFEEATELQTSKKRRYVNGKYSKTEYSFVWKDLNGRKLFEHDGDYVDTNGTPDRESGYWFGASAEKAWNEHLLKKGH